MIENTINDDKTIADVGKDITLAGCYHILWWPKIKTLFCDTVGPNVRNVVAHGLFGDGEINSYVPFYAWFFALRLVMKESKYITIPDGTLHGMEETK